MTMESRCAAIAAQRLAWSPALRQHVLVLLLQAALLLPRLVLLARLL